MPNDQALLAQLNRSIYNSGHVEEEDWGTWDYLREGFLDVPRGVASGVVGFTQSVGSLVDMGVEALGGDFVDDEILKSSYRPQAVTTKTDFGGFVDGVAQFATGYFLGGAAIKGVGAAKGIGGLVARAGKAGRVLSKSKIASAAGYGAVADFISFSGDEGRMADALLHMGGPGDNVITRWLATDEEDSWLEGRVKNVVEGAVLGVALDSVVSGVKAAIARGDLPETALEQLEETFPEMSEAEIKELDQGVSSEVKGSDPDLDDEDFSATAKRIYDDFSKAKEAGLSGVEAVAEGYGLHINYNRLKTTEDVRKLLMATESLTQGDIDAKIGARQTHEETIAEAAEWGVEDAVRAASELVGPARDLPALNVRLRGIRSGLAEKATELEMKLEAMYSGEIPFDRKIEREYVQVMPALNRVDILSGMLQKSPARSVDSGNIPVEGEEIAADMLAALRGEDTPAAKAAMAAAEKAAQEDDKVLAEILTRVAKDQDAGKDLREGSTIDSKASEGQVDSDSAPASGTPQNGSTGGSGGSGDGWKPPGEIKPLPKGAEYEPDPNIRKFIQGRRKAQGVGQGARYLRNAIKAKKANLMDAFIEFQTASILSGIPTFAINGISGGMMTMLNPATRLAGAVVSMDWKETRNSFRLVTQLVGALGDMVKYSFVASGGDGPRGLRAVGRTFMQEKPTLTEATAMEGLASVKAETFGLDSSSRAGKAVNAFGKWAVRLPFRLNQTMEEVWSQVNYLGYVRMQAIEATDAAIWNNPNVPVGQKESAALAFTEAYIKDAFDSFGAAKTRKAWWQPQDKPVFLHQDVVKYAQSVNHTQDLIYGIGNSLMKMKSQHRWMGLIVPFVKTPTNMLRTAMRMTPVIGQIQEHYQKRLMSRSRDEVLRARGEMLMGTALWGTAIAMVASGNITGGGPDNPRERAALLETGWRPYSFVQTDSNGNKTYIEYRRFDPFAMIFGMAADYADAGAYMEDGEKQNFATAAVLALSKNITNKTYLQGLTDLLKTITNPRRDGGTYLKNRMAALIPNVAARYAAADDDAMREARTVLDAMRRRIPGLSADLPPRRNILGEVITPTAGYIPFTNTTTEGTANWISRQASPAAFSRSVGDAVKDELAALHYGFSMPGVKMGGIDLTTVRTSSGQEAYDRYVELTGEVRINGKNMAETLESLINRSAYQKLPMPSSRSDSMNPRIQQVQRVIAAYRAKAQRELFKEAPAIREGIQEIKRTARGGGSKSPILERLQAL